MLYSPRGLPNLTVPWIRAPLLAFENAGWAQRFIDSSGFNQLRLPNG